MTAPVLHDGSQMGHNRKPGQNIGGWAVRECPECRKPFEPKVKNQLFCSPAHKNEWNNRATARGRVLTAYSVVAEITRNGTRGTPERREAGRHAARQKAQLIQRYRDEDRACAPPRMEWADYMILRVKLGLETR